MRTRQRGIIGGGGYAAVAKLAVLFYVVAVPLSTGLGMLELRQGTADTKERNTAVFQKLVSAKPDAANLAITWDTRQKAITHEIAANGASGIDIVPFFPFSVYAVDALRAADRAKIALVPHDKTVTDQRTTLVVDDRHGCLQVSLDQTDPDNATDARGLLYAYATRKEPGTYVFSVRGDLKSRHFTPLQPGQTAASVCPSPTL